MNNNKIKNICFTALGIALYVCISMLFKIPIGIEHLSLDLGYIVLAVYCYIYGGISGAIVGSCGCFIVSLIATQWISVGWTIGNFLIGFICGIVYNKMKDKKYGMIISVVTTIIAVFIGVGIIKTVVECAIYSMPILVKFAKNCVVFVIDAVVMSIGIIFAKQFSKIKIKIDLK